MLVSGRKYKAALQELAACQKELDDAKSILHQWGMAVRNLERERDSLREEVTTLNASLDATAAELEKVKGALKVSEMARKKMLKDRRAS